MGDPGETAADRGPVRVARRSAVAVLGVLAVALLVAWAAVAGPGRALEGEGPETGWVVPQQTPTDTPQCEPRDDREQTTTGAAGRSELDCVARTAEPPPPREAPVWFRVLVWVAMGTALLGMAGLLVWGLRRLRDLWQLRRHRAQAPAEREFGTLPDDSFVERVREELARDAPRQRGLLDEGTPTDAVIACWHRFEQQARRTGLEREPWETSAEFTRRALDLAAVDPVAVGRLAELFREARFSSHELGEPAREEARDALARIHHTLEAVR